METVVRTMVSAHYITFFTYFTFQNSTDEGALDAPSGPWKRATKNSVDIEMLKGLADDKEDSEEDSSDGDPYFLIVYIGFTTNFQQGVLG